MTPVLKTSCRLLLWNIVRYTFQNKAVYRLTYLLASWFCPIICLEIVFKKYAFWVYVEKYLNIAILFRISLRLKIQSDPSPWATDVYSNDLENTLFQFM